MLTLVASLAMAQSPAPVLGTLWVPPPDVVITNLPIGLELHDVSTTYYDPATELLTVAGTVSGLPTSATGWSVSVQALSGQALVVDAQGDASFSVTVDASAAPPPQTLDRVWYTDSRRVLLPVTVEVLDPNGRVLDRSRTVLYDARYDLDLHPSEPTGSALTDGASAQLTPSGLTATDGVHLDSLPWFGVADFEDELTAAAASTPGDLVATSGCQALSSGHPMTDSTTYREFKADAWTGYAAFRVAQAAHNTCVEPVWCAATLEAMEMLCFHEAPGAADFEVCAGSIDTQLTVLDVGAFDDTKQTFSATDTIVESTVSLTAIHGEATGVLEDVTLEWTGAKGLLCASAPSRELDPDDRRIRAVDDFLTCDDLTFEATSATSTHTFSVVADGTFPDELLVNPTSTPSFVTQGDTPSAGTGTCGDPEFAADGTTAALLLADDVVEALDTAWHAGAPGHQTQALDALLDVLEPGTVPLSDHTVAWSTGYASDDVAGARVSYQTDATHTGPWAEPPTWLWHEHADAPFTPHGHDTAGQPYDLAVSVTTGALNQAIRSVRPTRLDQVYLGTILNGPSAGPLTRLDPRLSGIAQLDLYAVPTLTPFTLMALDNLPTEPIGALPVSYQTGHLKVEMRVGEEVVGWFSVTLFDRDLDVRLHPTPDTFLDIDYGMPLWDFALMDLSLDACERTSLALPPTPCEAGLESLVRSTVSAALEDAVLSLLADVPAPHVFDAAGGSLSSVHVAPLTPALQPRRWQDGQQITLFADLLP